MVAKWGVNTPTNSDMGFFPPNMYDPQINMIMKPFVINKEKLRQDFNSPKYENRRKEFFATFSEFLRSYIRDKYYEFMNDIKTEVNFFAWYDHYFKPKILAGRNTNNSLPQKEVIKNSLPSSKLPSTDNASLTKQDIKISNTKRQDIKISNITPLTYACNNTLAFSSTSPDNFTRPLPSLISQNKYSNSLPQPTYSYSLSQDTPPNIQPLTKNHTNNITHATSDSILSPTSGNIHIATRQQDKHSMTPLTSNYQFNNNTHLDKKQTILSQYGQINTIKK
jgi:hypothetical protein